MLKILLALALFVMSASAADFPGTWSGEGLSEGETHSLYFILKEEGGKLAGSGGPNESEQHTIQNVKVEGSKLQFDVPAGKGVLHFELDRNGDEMKGTVLVKDEDGTHTGTVSLKRAG